MADATRVRLILADDHAVLRDGVRMILEAQPDLVVVGTADNGQQAVQLAAELRPDIAVLDIAMPELTGLEAARQITRLSPSTRIIFLSMHEGEDYLREALQAGASGYVLKRAAATELLNAIRAVCRGDAYIDPGLTRAMIGGYMRSDTHAGPSELTEREREVLTLVAEGMTNRQIALKLNISIKTVQSHRTNIMEKLDLHDRTELVRYAIRQGLIQP